MTALGAGVERNMKNGSALMVQCGHWHEGT